MLQRRTDQGLEQYSVRLEAVVDDNVVNHEQQQWLLVLDRIDGYDITNRPWMRVGPVFTGRDPKDQGSKWLGFTPGDKDAGEHRRQCMDEYASFFDDEPQGSRYTDFDKKAFPKLGRPSRGRSVRLQASVTPELADWLESQRGDGSVSDVVFKLLEGHRLT